MQNIIVTTGEKFTDIDGLACAISYTELLRLEGKIAETVLPGTLNHSITSTIKSWDLQYSIKPTFKEYTSVLVDISEAAYFAKCVDTNSILEIYDHRFGFQDYWKEKIGDKAHIEPVGSCATLIWEEFIKRGFSEKISTTSINLLLIAIVSNTLNFKAKITDKRDIKAFRELTKHCTLKEGWLEKYFNEQENEIFKDVQKAVLGDTKMITIPNFNLPVVMGQIELWDGSTFIPKYMREIKEALKSHNEENWFISVPSIKDGKNYLFTESDIVRHLLIKHIKAKFEPNSFTGFTDRLWLRKEIRSELFKADI